MSPSKHSSYHVPVLLGETMEALAVQPGGRYVDCTVGGGGHARAILERSFPGGQLLGIDADPEAIDAAHKRLEAHRSSVLLVNDNFVNLQATCIRYDFFPVHGILFDLGLSSMQLNGSGRGFSFQYDAPLDMRFNPGQEITAADIVNSSPEAELARIIRTYGEEGHSRQVARYIVRERPVTSTLHLARIVEKAVSRKGSKIHPATKTFQALRIAVNLELENLEIALKQAIELLGFEGRLVVISYHSLEDRIVKCFMQREARKCVCPPGTPVCVCGHKPRLKLIHRHVVAPSEDEMRANPRSRSAKLRAARLITQNDCLATEEMEVLLAETKARAWRRPALLRKLQMVFAMA
ncbi:MAG TPA: 16S rRNA (cytosine(1402)-N(4))-methyltransferase RsmH [Dehalococcoidia bacterium]|nr:16S rRNA (cytosine(1402)-N(4))-methyltransferase RsmH [Dehalococcoidia bacterium]